MLTPAQQKVVDAISDEKYTVVFMDYRSSRVAFNAILKLKAQGVDIRAEYTGGKMLFVRGETSEERQGREFLTRHLRYAYLKATDDAERVEWILNRIPSLHHLVDKLDGSKTDRLTLVD